MIEVRPATTQVDEPDVGNHPAHQGGRARAGDDADQAHVGGPHDYLSEHGIKVRYLHSDIETVERVEIIRDLRLGVFDVLIGINLLREGLDIPEVSLVAILDATRKASCARAAR